MHNKWTKNHTYYYSLFRLHTGKVKKVNNRKIIKEEELKIMLLTYSLLGNADKDKGNYN